MKPFVINDYSTPREWIIKYHRVSSTGKEYQAEFVVSEAEEFEQMFIYWLLLLKYFAVFSLEEITKFFEIIEKEVFLDGHNAPIFERDKKQMQFIGTIYAQIMLVDPSTNILDFWSYHTKLLGKDYTIPLTITKGLMKSPSVTKKFFMLKDLIHNNVKNLDNCIINSN